MNVDSTNAAHNPGPLSESPALPETEAGPKDEFLRLLVAQMQHQDPLEPQDGSEFVAQLAQFANIELGVETNARLASMEAGQVSASRASMMGLVGKNLTANAAEFKMTGQGPVPPLTVDLDDAATKIDVVVLDENGSEVTTIHAGPAPAGELAIDWNGLDKDGQPLAEGSYTLQVNAVQGEGAAEAAVDATISFSGQATSIEFGEDGTTLLGLGEALISPGSIQSVNDDT